MNKANKVHEKALTHGYKNATNLSFEDLLKNHKSVSIHERNLQILAAEIINPF